MSALHPLTFVFILVIVFCAGWLFGLRFGIVRCNVALREIRDELNKTADQLEQARKSRTDFGAGTRGENATEIKG